MNFEETLWQKYGLRENELQRILTREPSLESVKIPATTKTIRFAAIGDTHLGSKKDELSALHQFYRILKRKKISIVLHAGDILDGMGVYRGQEFELAVFGADNQISYAVKHYPKISGITTYFINGNHDYSFYKKLGLDTGAVISRERKDLVYLGHYKGEVNINGIKIWLVHPDGGMPYAISYRGQKYVEQIESGHKPRILLLGHLHTAYFFEYRNIYVFGVGCFQGQTPFILRKGINPVIGGWIIEVKVDKKNSIRSVVSEFIRVKY